MSLKFLAALFFLQPVALFPVIILVHTSNPDSDAINTYMGGDYYRTIAAKAKKMGESVVGFQWLEKDMPQKEAFQPSWRIRGAGALAKKIIDYKSAGERVTVIGHSYGGQVANGASVFLSDEPHDFASSSFGSLVPETDVFSINVRNKKIKAELLKQKKAVTAYKKKMMGEAKPTHWIDMLYDVVTPIDSDVFAVDTSVVGHYIALYSAADLQVTAAGIRLAALDEKTANLRIFIDGKNPHHSRATSADEIGTWILDIPDYFKEQALGGWQEFSYGQNGIVSFSADLTTYPTYVPDLSRKPFGGKFMFLRISPQEAGENFGQLLKRHKKKLVTIVRGT